MTGWIYEKRELRATPSYKDEIDYDTETKFRREGARLIVDVGADLNLRYDTVATGCVYFHRFFMHHSFKEFNRYVTAIGALFLAGKVEETPKKCKDLLRVTRARLTESQFAAFGDDPKEEVMVIERVLLQTVKFDLQIEHPYQFLIKYAKVLIGSKSGIENLVQMAWTFINDSLCTTISLQWEPEIVAIALMYLASRLGKVSIPDWKGRKNVEGEKWWDQFVEDLGLDVLEEICHQVLDLYSPHVGAAPPGVNVGGGGGGAGHSSSSAPSTPASGVGGGSKDKTPTGAPSSGGSKSNGSIDPPGGAASSSNKTSPNSGGGVAALSSSGVGPSSPTIPQQQQHHHSSHSSAPNPIMRQDSTTAAAAKSSSSTTVGGVVAAVVASSAAGGGHVTSREIAPPTAAPSSYAYPVTVHSAGRSLSTSGGQRVLMAASAADHVTQYSIMPPTAANQGVVYAFPVTQAPPPNLPQPHAPTVTMNHHQLSVPPPLMGGAGGARPISGGGGGGQAQPFAFYPQPPPPSQMYNVPPPPNQHHHVTRSVPLPPHHQQQHRRNNNNNRVLTTVAPPSYGNASTNQNLTRNHTHPPPPHYVRTHPYGRTFD